MSEIDQKLDAILDIESDIKEKTAVVKLPDRKELVERGQDAIDGILELSKETEHPRAYEVAGQLIKTVGETAEKLIDLQSKLKKLDGEEQKVGTQHNHLYVGSTSELQKFLKKKNVKE